MRRNALRPPIFTNQPVLFQDESYIDIDSDGEELELPECPSDPDILFLGR